MANINSINATVMTDNNGNIIIPKTIAEAIFVSYTDNDGTVMNTTLDKALFTIHTRISSMSGFAVSDTAPDNKGSLWIDSANSYVMKFYDTSTSTWKTVGAAWAE